MNNILSCGIGTQLFTSKFSVIYSSLLLLVDCEWETYGEWSSCSKSCGGGNKMRSRTKTTYASKGGQDCVGDSIQTEICNEVPCPGNRKFLF